MMSKLSLKFVFIFLLFLASPVQASTLQEQTAQNPLAFLKPLVGKKCAVHLKNGQVINGTLWVYGTDHISVKVKKGLLYSKTEKYYASEIDFLKDKAANRYYMPRADQAANVKLSPGHSIDLDQSSEKKDSKSEQEFQGTFKFLKKRQEKQKESYTVPLSAPKTTYKKTRPPVVKKAKPALNNKIEKPKTPKPNRYSARPREAKKEVSTPAKPTSFAKRTPTKKQVIPEPQPEVVKETKQPYTQQPPAVQVKTFVAESDSPKPGALWNIKFALLGSGVLIIAALILFKIVRVKYRKQTLFPTRVMEIQGKYAVIDHGKTDGIKTDDIIRLYKKTASQIQYKGKTKVKKVGENYSAVELIKLEPGQELEISDVGFRDRNLVAAAFKQFRIITSVGLRSLAKGLRFTANHIDVKSDEPYVDWKPPKEEFMSDVGTVDTQKQKVVTVTSSPLTTTKSFNNSKPWDYGGD